MENKRGNRTVLIAVIGSIILAVILIGGIFWTAESAHRDASEAAHSVSLLYMDELAGRREQVVEDKLNGNIDVIRIALEMLNDGDLSDVDHLREYQRRVKRFFSLERFAFVDENGLVYTADEGVRDEMDQYPFDHQTLSPEMDGLEATRNIRASGREDAETIPIIALTANAFDEDVQRSMQAGLNAHLSKPVEPDALFDTLETMIRP